jgi:hypothetical protein
LRRVNELRSPLDSFRRKDPPSPLPSKAVDMPPKSTAALNTPQAAERTARRGSESEGSDYGETPVKSNGSPRIAPPPSAYDRHGGSGLNSSLRSHTRGDSSESAQSAYSSKSAAALRAAIQRSSSQADTDRLTTSKSNSIGRERSFSPEAKRKDFDDSASMRSRRSDRSPDAGVKPTQTRQSPARERSATRDRERERAPRKPKICVRCEKKIDDGKWVSVDGGGVLCEKCWKNMYLPKVRDQGLGFSSLSFADIRNFTVSKMQPAH